MPEILHDAVAGRVRFHHAKLRAQPRLEHAIVDALLAQPGVRSACASAHTGSILVRFEKPASTARLARVIANADRPPKRLVKTTNGWHEKSAAETLRALAATRTGLSDAEAAPALAPRANELARAEPRSALSIFGEQLSNLPMALLGASAGVSLLTGGIADAVAIGAVMLANAGIGTATERQAERMILGLSRYAPQPVPVRRAGRRRLVPPGSLVPGDLIELEPGTLVAADARLLEAGDLTVNEGALTGEALPVHKDALARLAADTALAERANMVFRGTAVTGGRALAVVTATGVRTELGHIQLMLGTGRAPQTPSPNQTPALPRRTKVAAPSQSTIVILASPSTMPHPVVHQSPTRPGDARVRVEQAVALPESHELSRALVQLIDDEAFEGGVALEEPHEGEETKAHRAGTWWAGESSQRS